VASQAKALLRIEAVAETLGISRARAYAMAADGRLPSVRIGRSRRVPARQLEEWIELHVVDALPVPATVPANQTGETGQPETLDVGGRKRAQS